MNEIIIFYFLHQFSDSGQYGNSDLVPKLFKKIIRIKLKLKDNKIKSNNIKNKKLNYKIKYACEGSYHKSF